MMAIPMMGPSSKTVSGFSGNHTRSLGNASNESRKQAPKMYAKTTTGRKSSFSQANAPKRNACVQKAAVTMVRIRTMTAVS